LRDLHEVMGQASQEKRVLGNSKFTQHDKDKRLMYLFIRDLLPGLHGKILEAKDSRESFKLSKVSSVLKTLGWLLLFSMNAVFLFYIFLFAMRQSKARQSDWFLTFMIWILFDITVASTMVVVVLHVLIPSLAIRDLRELKKKLLHDIISFKRDLGSKKPENVNFNAAEYLFVSHHVASTFPDWEQSKVILQFSTPWPKRSYKVKRKDVKRSYQKNYSFFIQFSERMLVFVLTNFLTIPHSLQDTIMHMLLTSGLGFMISLFVKLYHVSPILVGVPILALFLIIHFWVQAERRSEQLKHLSLVPEVEQTLGKNNPHHQEASSIRTGVAEEDPLHLPSVGLSVSLEEGTSPNGRLKSRRESLQEATSTGLRLIHSTHRGQLERIGDESGDDDEEKVDPDSSSSHSHSHSDTQEPIVISLRTRGQQNLSGEEHVVWTEWVEDMSSSDHQFSFGNDLSLSHSKEEDYQIEWSLSTPSSRQTLMWEDGISSGEVSKSSSSQGDLTDNSTEL
jgi:hypothetical protein